MTQSITSKSFMGSNHRHAYLIMAHKNWYQLRVLLSLLDDPRNDLYLHIDKKAKPSPSILDSIKKTCRFSKLYIINSVPVVWGGYSVIEAELCLLKASVKKGYRYYHLLSGQDLPICTIDEIYSFFEKHDGSEFIDFGNKEWIESVEPRCKYFWLFQELIGRDEKKLLRFLERVSIKLQKTILIDRMKNRVFSAGSNWFSITNELANYVLSQNQQIKKRFRLTQNADECFLQCLVMESEFRKKVWMPESRKQDSMLRLVDFNRGNPYIYRMADYEELMGSDNLFARKFDIEIDSDIISAIKEKICMDVRRNEQTTRL